MNIKREKKESMIQDLFNLNSYINNYFNSNKQVVVERSNEIDNLFDKENVKNLKDIMNFISKK